MLSIRPTFRQGGLSLLAGPSAEKKFSLSISHEVSQQ